MSFTFEQKLEAVKREISYRQRVYKRRVAEGKMRQALADRQVAIMQAIASDYEKAVATQAPGLF